MQQQRRRQKHECALVVTGSRELKDEDEKAVAAVISEHYTSNSSDLLVVGDCPSGADKFAARWALAEKKPLMKFKADWKKYNAAAGPIRNKEMLKWAIGNCKRVVVLALPLAANAKGGTRQCIAEARKLKLAVTVIEQK